MEYSENDPDGEDNPDGVSGHDTNEPDRPADRPQLEYPNELAWRVARAMGMQTRRPTRPSPPPS